MASRWRTRQVGVGCASESDTCAAFASGRWEKWYGFELRNDPFDTCYFEDDDPTPRKIEGYQTDGLFQIGMDHLKDRADERPFCMVISVEGCYGGGLYV
jgi:hypothetical protein